MGRKPPPDAEPPKPVPEVRVDPELTRQLDAAGDDQLVQAVFQLRRQSADGTAPDVDEQARRLVDEGESAVGRRPHRSNVLRNMRVLIVEGTGPLVRWISTRKDLVEAATANRRAKA